MPISPPLLLGHYTYGTGPIKGFAVTLMIGIVTTLFTGVFVSRALIEFMIRKPAQSCRFRRSHG